MKNKEADIARDLCELKKILLEDYNSTAVEVLQASPEELSLATIDDINTFKANGKQVRLLIKQHGLPEYVSESSDHNLLFDQKATPPSSFIYDLASDNFYAYISEDPTRAGNEVYLTYEDPQKEVDIIWYDDESYNLDIRFRVPQPPKNSLGPRDRWLHYQTEVSYLHEMTSMHARFMNFMCEAFFRGIQAKNN